MPIFFDLSGQKIGKLRIIKRVGTGSSGPTWQCICECGNKPIVVGKTLRSAQREKRQISCGCARDRGRYRGNAHLYECNGQAKTIGKWASELKCSIQVLYNRIYLLDWPIEKALSTPVKSMHKGKSSGIS